MKTVINVCCELVADYLKTIKNGGGVAGWKWGHN